MFEWRPVTEAIKRSPAAFPLYYWYVEVVGLRGEGGAVRGEQECLVRVRVRARVRARARVRG